MLNRLTSLTALACVLMLPLLSHAAETVEAELPMLSKLVIVSGPAELPGALPALTPDARLIAANFENATAKTDRSTLVVGVKSDQPKGTVLVRAEFASDCPDNSQFQIKEQVADAINSDHLKAALADWTRHRHDAANATVREIREPSYHYAKGVGKFIDVRLDLRQLSAR